MAKSIACAVHGLHYVGDKLGAIARAVRSLHPKGLFVANLGLDGFRSKDGRPAGRLVAQRLREAGAVYDAATAFGSCGDDAALERLDDPRCKPDRRRATLGHA